MEDARRTLYQAAERPSQSKVLPPGKQTVLHALLKAREEVDSRPHVSYPAHLLLLPAVRDAGPRQTALARPAAAVAAATPASPPPVANDTAVARTAAPVEPAIEINPSPTPMATSDLNVEPEPVVMPSSYAPPAETPYRGGLVGALIRRARKQTEQ